MQQTLVMWAAYVAVVELTAYFAGRAVGTHAVEVVSPVHTAHAASARVGAAVVHVGLTQGTFRTWVSY